MGKGAIKDMLPVAKIPKAITADLCVYRALSALYRWGNHSPRAPVIAFRDGKPITIKHMRSKWTAALNAIGLQDKGFTLHSLRRGGARFLQDNGVEESTIASHVGWRSAAMFDYVDAPVISRPLMHLLCCANCISWLG